MTAHRTPVAAPGDDIVEDLHIAIEATVRPAAADVDRTGNFPRESLDALRTVGVLGLLSSRTVGGGQQSLRTAAAVVESLGGVCGSTAMVIMMHYCAVAVIEEHGPEPLRRAVADGAHLSTLAFSETGSRSHFWTPTSLAQRVGDTVRLDARKSWVTAAAEADSYVWSSKPTAGTGPMSLWLVPAASPGLRVEGTFDGLGLRGNASSPVTATGVEIPACNALGQDGQGLQLALTLVLPRFFVLSAAFSLGVMETLMRYAAAHLTQVRLEHLDQSLAEQPGHRSAFAELRIRTDQSRSVFEDVLRRLEAGRSDTTMGLLQLKAVTGEAAADVADGVMRLCGGSALRRGNGIERHFRDALAARVMAPTTEALHDFVGRAGLGLPLFDETIAS